MVCWDVQRILRWQKWSWMGARPGCGNLQWGITWCTAFCHIRLWASLVMTVMVGSLQWLTFPLIFLEAHTTWTSSSNSGIILVLTLALLVLPMFHGSSYVYVKQEIGIVQTMHDKTYTCPHGEEMGCGSDQKTIMAFTNALLIGVPLHADRMTIVAANVIKHKDSYFIVKMPLWVQWAARIAPLVLKFSWIMSSPQGKQNTMHTSHKIWRQLNYLLNQFSIFSCIKYHHSWMARSCMEWEVSWTLLQMTGSGNQTPNILILKTNIFSLGEYYSCRAAAETNNGVFLGGFKSTTLSTWAYGPKKSIFEEKTSLQ